MPRITIEEIPYGGARYDEVTALRHELLRRPLGLDFTAKELEAERNDMHLAALAGPRVVGTLLLRRVDERVARIMRMAVAPEMQGRSIGRALVAHAEGLAGRAGFESLMMHARASALGFYARCGYERVGEAFLELGIAHVRMEKSLARGVEAESNGCVSGPVGA